MLILERIIGIAKKNIGLYFLNVKESFELEIKHAEYASYLKEIEIIT